MAGIDTLNEILNRSQPRLTPNELAVDPMYLPLYQAEPEGFWSRQWDRIASTAAQPGDEIAKILFKNFAEIPANFEAGIMRSAYDYGTAANEIGEYVADKFDLDIEHRSDFLTAWTNKFKNTTQIDPTSEDWEDQLFYLIGNIAPDIVMTVLGGGILGGFAAAGARAAGMSYRAATVTTMLGRIVGDTAANVGTFMAHEAGQAQLEGREAEYAATAGEALAMSALMSTTGRASQALGLKRRYGSALTAGIMYGVSEASGGDGDTNMAHAVMGGLFGLGVTSGTLGPVDILKWTRARRASGKPVLDYKDYLKEFFPNKYNAIYEVELVRDARRIELGLEALSPDYMSPWDNFLIWMRQSSESEVFGYSDNQLVSLLAKVAQETGPAEFSTRGFQLPKEQWQGAREAGAASAQSPELFARTMESAQLVIREMRKVNDEWLKDNPGYEAQIREHIWNPRTTGKERSLGDLKYADESVETRTRAGEKDLFDKPTIPSDEAGNVAVYKGELLRLHELTKQEVHGLFGRTDNKAWNSNIEEMHRRSIDDAIKTFTHDEKKTWPNLSALIDYGRFKDAGYIHRQTKFVSSVKTNKTVRDIADDLLERVRQSQDDTRNMLKIAEHASDQPFLDFMYRGFVATEGRLMDKLETHPDLLLVRNAFQSRYSLDSFTSHQVEKVKERVGWTNMTTDQRELLDAAYKARAEQDFLLRRGAYPPANRQDYANLSSHTVVETYKTLVQDGRKYQWGKDGRKNLDDMVDVIKDTYVEYWKKMYDEGLIGEETYSELKDLYYTPQKTLEAVRDLHYRMNVGLSRRDLHTELPQVLQDLSVQTGQKIALNTEYLLSDHIIFTNKLINKNRFLREAADVAIGSKNAKTDLFAVKSPKYGGKEKQWNYVEFNYFDKPVVGSKSAEGKTIWIEGRTAKFMQDQQFIDKKTNKLISWFSGAAPIRLTAVALNPVFAMVTHTLDMLHIMTHHAAMGNFSLLDATVPKQFWNFEIWNKERGAVPFLKNLRSVLKKGPEYDQYVNAEGTTATLVSRMQEQELIKSAHAYDVKGAGLFPDSKAANAAAEKYNGAIKFFGKFGHAMEVATRMTEVDMLMSTGKFATKFDAAAESLRRLNYNRRGSVVKVFESVIPFLNAQAQILASNISEMKTLPKAGRSLAVMAQLSFAQALLRSFVEESSPGIMEEIPWEDRMRYWIVPLPYSKYDPENGEQRKAYFKIKKAYNPFFTAWDAIAQLSMDKFYYGKLPPNDVFTAIWDGIAVSAPVELRNMIPPALDAYNILENNATTGGRKAYKGPAVELQDEINTKLTGGRETSALAIAFGAATGGSPARTQAIFNEYIADNPLAYLVSLPFTMPTEQQQTVIDSAVKFAGSRKYIGLSRPSWAEYERGEKFIEKGGSSKYRMLTSKIEGSLVRFHDNQLTPLQFSAEVAGAMRGSDNVEFQLKAQKIVLREIKARTVLNGFIKRYSIEEVGENLPTNGFWRILRQIPTNAEKAEYYYDMYLETPSGEWQRNLRRLAHARGFFTPQVMREFKKLERMGDRV